MMMSGMMMSGMSGMLGIGGMNIGVAGAGGNGGSGGSGAMPDALVRLAVAADVVLASPTRLPADSVWAISR